MEDTREDRMDGDDDCINKGRRLQRESLRHPVTREVALLGDALLAALEGVALALNLGDEDGLLSSTGDGDFGGIEKGGDKEGQCRVGRDGPIPWGLDQVEGLERPNKKLHFPIFLVSFVLRDCNRVEVYSGKIGNQSN